jgi:hypothetical protein
MAMLQRERNGALFGVHGVTTLKKYLTTPALLETPVLVNHVPSLETIANTVGVQSDMTARLRWSLLLAFGLVDTVLILWHIHNVRVIESVGMGWDTGAPLWPYQTPDTLLFALNTPAYFIGVPIGRALGLYVPWHYVVLYPMFLCWWFLAGYAIDSAFWKGERLHWRWKALAIVCAVILTAIGVAVLRDAVVWWTQYCRSFFTARNIITLRLSAPGLWCLVFAAAAVVLAKRHRPLSC